MDKIAIRNIALLAPLLYLYQNLFLWSKNVSMFTASQLIYSFCAIIIISAITFFLFYFLLVFIFSKSNNKWLRIAAAVFIGTFIGIVSNFLFLRTIFYPHNHTVMWILIIGIILIIYFNAVKYFLNFCYLLLAFASCSFIYNGYVNFTSTIDDTDKFIVELKDKPNIYMFWLESFHGTRTLNNVYHADISPLIEFLEKNNFSVGENVYASSFFTLASMTDLFSLGTENIFDYAVGKMDAAGSVRKLIGGGDGNNVLKILKYNGYLTSFISHFLYLFQEKEKYLDFATVDSYTNYISHYFPCYAFCKYANQILEYGVDIARQEHTRLIKTDNYKFPLLENIELEINKMQKMNKPYFLTFKGGVFHIGTDGPYTNENKNHWVKTSGYKDAVEKNMSEIEEIVSLIIKKDPNALIVMLGDHGAYIHRSNLNNTIPFDEIADDYFNVFGAVRLPQQYQRFSFDSNETYINHMNIFVHIFSILAHDPEYIKLQEIPVSRFPQGNIVVNGKINNNFSFKN